MCRIIAKLMSKDPADRYGSAREVAELLEKCLAHVQQPTVGPLPRQLAPPVRRTATAKRFAQPVSAFDRR